MCFDDLGIEPIAILEGRLPRRAASMVFEWAALDQPELMENWRRPTVTLEVVTPAPTGARCRPRCKPVLNDRGT
ncbi:MAG: DUF4160 domain-containing protein [Bryobacteraceae bacterium]